MNVALMHRVRFGEERKGIKEVKCSKTALNWVIEWEKGVSLLIATNLKCSQFSWNYFIAPVAYPPAIFC